MNTSDRVQAWSEFLDWWREHVAASQSPAVEEYYAKDTAGRAWLAACEWAWSLRGSE